MEVYRLSYGVMKQWTTVAIQKFNIWNFEWTGRKKMHKLNLDLAFYKNRMRLYDISWHYLGGNKWKNKWGYNYLEKNYYE